MKLLTDEQKAALKAQSHSKGDSALILVHLVTPILDWHVYLYSGGQLGDTPFIAEAFVCGRAALGYERVDISELEATADPRSTFVDDDWEPLPVEEQEQRLTEAYRRDAALKPWFNHPKRA